MRRLMRITRAVGFVLGGVVALVAMMSVIGLATDNFWIRLLGGLLVVVGIPAFVSDRLLRRTSLGGLSFVFDVFAIVLLALSLAVVSANVVSKPLLLREGDRYARSGSRTTARLVYWLAGVSPTFPEQASVETAPSASASASTAGDAGAGK